MQETIRKRSAEIIPELITFIFPINYYIAQQLAFKFIPIAQTSTELFRPPVRHTSRLAEPLVRKTNIAIIGNQ
jgi:hypothetical protein